LTDQAPDKISVRDNSKVLPGYRQRSAKEDVPLVHFRHDLLEMPVYSLTSPIIGTWLIAFQAEHRYDMLLFLEPVGHLIVDQQAVGEQRKDDSGKVTGDVQDFRTGQRFTAEEYDDRYTHLVGLCDHVPELVSTHLRFKRSLLGPRIAPFTLKVATLCDTGEHERRDVDTSVFPISSNLYGLVLSPHRTVQKKGHGWFLETEMDDLLAKKILHGLV
jgi:hypothetical protein